MSLILFNCLKGISYGDISQLLLYINLGPSNVHQLPRYILILDLAAGNFFYSKEDDNNDVKFGTLSVEIFSVMKEKPLVKKCNKVDVAKSDSMFMVLGAPCGDKGS